MTSFSDHLFLLKQFLSTKYNFTTTLYNLQWCVCVGGALVCCSDSLSILTLSCLKMVLPNWNIGEQCNNRMRFCSFQIHFWFWLHVYSPAHIYNPDFSIDTILIDLQYVTIRFKRILYTSMVKALSIGAINVTWWT